MNKKHVSAVLLGAALLISGESSAYPTGLQCPQLVTNSSAVCIFNVSVAGETVILTISNDALTFQPGYDNREMALGTVGNTGSFTVYSKSKRGQVTVCAYDVLRRYRTCSITYVN